MTLLRFCVCFQNHTRGGRDREEIVERAWKWRDFGPKKLAQGACTAPRVDVKHLMLRNGGNIN